ncbi:MAG TPA: glycoside hydrolase family 43 protein [Candidatus Synoicihabitans sp.]|nr:glycoside hydrolase family 43 protein [Candidatus Synoicihabitans sp.]
MNPTRRRDARFADAAAAFGAKWLTGVGLLVGCLLPLASPAKAAAAPALPETCFLYSYFYHHDEGGGLRLAWSADGLTFQALNQTRSYLVPTVGEAKIMRDPAILLGPDQRFHLVWTTGWTGKTIGYASSTDLIEWSPQQELPVMAHEPEAQNCWAPELVWDARRSHYLIVWSTTILGRYPETALSNRRPERNHRIYATTTKDFRTFTPTELMYEGGFNVIDAAFLPHGDDWLMFVKDETFAPQTQKNIRLVHAQTPHGPFGEPSEPITGDYWAEGPSPLKVGDEWWVYFDKHMLNALGLVRSRDLRTWEDISDRIRAPADARHGTIIQVPRAVIERLLAHEAEATGTP